AINFIRMSAILIISIILLLTIQAEGIITIDFGGWEAPFGISFVADSFATLLVLTTSLISSLIIIFAFQTIGEKREQLYFYAFVNFLIDGVNGSFLTGDLFNLFVTLEIILLFLFVLFILICYYNYLYISFIVLKYRLIISLSYILTDVPCVICFYYVMW